MSKNKIALICFKPNDIYLDFLNKFSNYEVYIIIDDNSVNYALLYQQKYGINNKLKIVQMPDKICKQYGFTNVNRIGVKKLVSGWDKALCYFSFEANDTDKIWFIEDDVFFHSEEALMKIDAVYPDYDLLANCDFKPATNKNEWLWNYIDIKIPGPHYSGMMCASRLSFYVLNRIRNYANVYKELFFLEALLPTLSRANTNNEKKELKCGYPNELKTVVYRHNHTYNYSYDSISNKDNIYHPVKDIFKHNEFRNQLSK